MRRSEALVYALGIGHSNRASFVGRGDRDAEWSQMNVLRGFSDDTGGRAELIDDLNGAGRRPCDADDRAIRHRVAAAVHARLLSAGERGTRQVAAGAGHDFVPRLRSSRATRVCRPVTRR